MRMPLSSGGCWCMLPASHAWPGKEDGAPHPRRALQAGLARQPLEQGPCMNADCDRPSEPGVWFCCGLCAEASGSGHAPVVHADPCSDRSAPDDAPEKVQRKGDTTSACVVQSEPVAQQPARNNPKGTIFMRFRIAALAASAAVVGALAIPAAAQAATARHNPAPQAVNGTTKGLAGYYENQRSDWKYRDVRAGFTVTAEMEELNSTGTFGRTGVWQCNPNTGTAVQSGIEWTGSEFEAVYAKGTLTSSNDPCVTGGLLAPVPFTGNITGITINIGDAVEFEQYYNTASHWETVTAIDLTQNTQSAASFYEGFPNFYEAGAGVTDECAPNLAPPAVNLVTQFSAVRVTTYNSKHPGTSLGNGHDTESVTAFNHANAVLVPTTLSGGTSFAVNAGISTP